MCGIYTWVLHWSCKLLLKVTTFILQLVGANSRCVGVTRESCAGIVTVGIFRVFHLSKFFNGVRNGILAHLILKTSPVDVI